jgi:drug/metabolite transporter (DMT)-like permease
MADAGPLGPATVVVLGLLSAASFGASDFGGGLSSRRAPIFGVMLVASAAGVVLALFIALLTGEPLPEPGAAASASLGGVCGVIGLLGLYHGLAVGRMGVVAPVVGVVGASLPVVVGVAVQGAPQPAAAVGIGLAILAVVIVSRAPSVGDRPSGIEFALLGGLGIGLVSTLIGRLPEGSVWWPLVILKLSAIAVLVAVIVAGRRPWRVSPRALFLPTAAVGVGDMAGNGFYVLATQAGRLDVAAVLSSLYPVVTVVLAIVFLREQVGRSQAVGIATAAIAVALIAAGSNAPG